MQQLKKENQPKVIVVEDNPDFAQLLHDILEIQGCSVTVVYNASSALELAKTMMPDMIFCDLGLPGELNGLSFARRLRNDKTLAHIPLVAITGYTHEKDRTAALESGFNLVFPKPFKFADLTQALSTYTFHS